MVGKGSSSICIGKESKTAFREAKNANIFAAINSERNPNSLDYHVPLLKNCCIQFHTRGFLIPLALCMFYVYICACFRTVIQGNVLISLLCAIRPPIHYCLNMPFAKPSTPQEFDPMPVAEVVASACDLEGDTCFLFTIVLKSKPTLRPFLFPPYGAKGS